jgi:hypothetical protein
VTRTTILTVGRLVVQEFEMKIIASSTLGAAFLIISSYLFLIDFPVSVASYSETPSPTPPSKKRSPDTASPTPTCSPQHASDEQGISLEAATNLIFGTPDWDCDGIVNFKDNCIFVYNPGQRDTNADGKGDVCDPELIDPTFQDSRCDEDHDGIPDFRDNCLVVCNPDQKDINKNGIGDVCDQAFPNHILTLKACPVPKEVRVPKPILLSPKKS